MSLEIKNEDIYADLPIWQKELIDKRLEQIRLYPERLRPIEELFAELEKEIEVKS